MPSTLREGPYGPMTDTGLRQGERIEIALRCVITDLMAEGLCVEEVIGLIVNEAFGIALDESITKRMTAPTPKGS